MQFLCYLPLFLPVFGIYEVSKHKQQCNEKNGCQHLPAEDNVGLGVNLGNSMILMEKVMMMVRTS